MAAQFPGPRKRRTRQHVIADLGVHHVIGFLLDSGHTAQSLAHDYGYDLIAWTYDKNGYAEPGSLLFQVKASDSLQVVGTDYVFDLDIRDYNLWMQEEMPVILILFDASRRRAYWASLQDYFRKDPSHRPKTGARTVRVKISMGQRVNRPAIERMRQLKLQVVG
jgi:hypothetical protein